MMGKSPEAKTLKRKKWEMGARLSGTRTNSTNLYAKGCISLGNVYVMTFCQNDHRSPTVRTAQGLHWYTLLTTNTTSLFFPLSRIICSVRGRPCIRRTSDDSLIELPIKTQSLWTCLSKFDPEPGYTILQAQINRSPSYETSKMIFRGSNISSLKISTRKVRCHLATIETRAR